MSYRNDDFLDDYTATIDPAKKTPTTSAPDLTSNSSLLASRLVNQQRNDAYYAHEVKIDDAVTMGWTFSELKCPPVGCVGIYDRIRIRKLRESIDLSTVLCLLSDRLRIEEMLDKLTKASAEYFSADADSLDWEHVELVSHAARKMQEACDCLGL